MYRYIDALCSFDEKLAAAWYRAPSLEWKAELHLWRRRLWLVMAAESQAILRGGR
jgi:hypothetical protein